MIRRFRIKDRSMEPALADGDWIFCRSLTTRPRRGAIVVFRHPARPEMWMVKRVLGLPGEEIRLDFGDVLVDGETGIDRWGTSGQSFPEGAWRVGHNEVFVLSDNRKATLDDGRSFGPVTTEGMLRLTWPRP